MLHLAATLVNTLLMFLTGVVGLLGVVLGAGLVAGLAYLAINYVIGLVKGYRQGLARQRDQRAARAAREKGITRV